jgi:hypothetical protein
MYSGRNFPRGQKCGPKNSVVIFLYQHGKYIGTQKYAWVGDIGTCTVGYFGKDLPAGDY